MDSISKEKDKPLADRIRARFSPRKIALFVAVALLWLLIDQATKAHFESLPSGGSLGGPYLNLFEFRLAHNTGGAWSMFSGSTFFLGMLSIAICLVVVVFFLISMREMSLLTVASLALVFAGGLGNALDRFMNGYVVDFISCTFIDFPVFNIADIGITCGIALFALSLILDAVHDKDDLSAGKGA